MKKSNLIQTFNVGDATSGTQIGTVPTGFSWNDIAYQTEDAFPKQLASHDNAEKYDHRERFERILHKAATQKK